MKHALRSSKAAMKRIVLPLIMVLVLTTLAGCQKSGEDPSSSETVEVSGSSIENSQQETERTEEPDEVSIEESATESVEEIAEELVTEENEEEEVIAEKTIAPGPFELSDVQPTIKDGKYQYNPYALSQEAIQCFDENLYAFYKDFITAYMNYETSCYCPSREYVQQLNMILDYECAFYQWGDLDLNWAVGYDESNHCLSWEYLVDQETLQERIGLVGEAMQEYLDLVSPEDDEADKMQTLYHAFCPQMTYDYDSMDSRENIESCYAFLEHRGICVTFAYAFSQLLSQVGIDVTIGAGPVGDESHVWNYACINGEYYFFDTTFELNFKEGNAYVYYGMTLEERVDSGAEEDTMWLGRYRSYEIVTAESHLNVH